MDVGSVGVSGIGMGIHRLFILYRICNVYHGCMLDMYVCMSVGLHV
jgi:hypothetical protein